MPPAKETRLQGHLGRGALLSLFLHAQLLVPLLIVISIYAAREAAERPEEVDVAFRDVSNDELPADLPPVDDVPPPPRATPERPDQPRRPPEKKLKDKLKPPAAKLAEKKPEPTPKSKPEPEVPIPPMPPMPKEEPPPVPKPEIKGHEKMVDLDNDKEVEPPPDAKYLAQKNNRAEVETRSTDTNLEKRQEGTTGSSPSERQAPEVGDDKSKIAELEDVKSALGKKAPDVTPHTNPEMSEPEPPPVPTPKSLLALRDAARREHEITPETVDPSLPRTPDGTIAVPDRGVRGPRTDAARLDRGKRMKLGLSAKDYEYLFGADAEAERRLAQKERSKKVGRFQQRVGRVQSALENFIPEVKPGNQDRLNTRAAPFAAFIARMHRSIHKLWGFGMLEEWDERSGSNPLNNPDLLTTLELVLNGDGTLEKVTIVKTSGLLEYDAAAIDVAYSAGPYPDPPREIRSKNGKIYVHWRFYRDARQCATSGVDYFILNNPPAGGDRADPAVPESAAATVAPGVAPRLGGGMGSSPSGSGSPSSSESAEGPRHLERGDRPGAAAASRHARLAAPPAGEETTAERPPAPVPALANPARAENPAARALARGWFDAFARGDVMAMLGKAIYPFRSTSGNVASSRGDLATMLKALIDESPAAGRGVASLQLFTAAALRGVIGRLPPGLDDGSGQLFAVAKTAGNDTLILILSSKAEGWRIAGLARR
jgi:hypothetical protein